MTIDSRVYLHLTPDGWVQSEVNQVPKDRVLTLEIILKQQGSRSMTESSVVWSNQNADEINALMSEFERTVE